MEHVIQDGHSSDGTFGLVEAYAAEATHEVSYASGQDIGFYDGINKALRRSTGEIIGLINADDWLADAHVLNDVVRIFCERPETQVLYADLDYVRLPRELKQVAEHNTSLQREANGTGSPATVSTKLHGTATEPPCTHQPPRGHANALQARALSADFPIHQVVRHWIAGQYSIASFRNGWMPPHPTIYVRRQVYDDLGGYRLDMGSAADYEWIVRVFVKHRIKSAYLPRVTVKMLVGGQSNTSLLGRMRANRKDREAWRINGLKPFPWFFLLKPARKLPQFFRR